VILGAINFGHLGAAIFEKITGQTVHVVFRALSMPA
jgi:uncharacterized membrane protein YuzA (DUF378 family)